MPPSGDVHRASTWLRACAQEKGGLPDIASAVQRLNALPAPADGPCFVATAPRPLALVATVGVTSAQPAFSRASPRIFLLLPGLVVGVVPEGEGSALLEFGQWVTPTRTLKGEVEVPVTAKLADDAPFSHVTFDENRTTCSLCHRFEEVQAGVAGAYVSVAYQPEPSTLVPLKELVASHQRCIADNSEDGRCAMFHALFDFGEVTQGAFAPEVATF
jgi:hypothetical protein